MPSGKLGDVQPTQVALAMHQLTPPFHFRVAESQPLHGPRQPSSNRQPFVSVMDGENTPSSKDPKYGQLRCVFG